MGADHQVGYHKKGSPWWAGDKANHTKNGRRTERARIFENLNLCELRRRALNQHPVVASLECIEYAFENIGLSLQTEDSCACSERKSLLIGAFFVSELNGKQKS